MTEPVFIPVYHDTSDKRIQQWVYKNLTTHELKNAQTTTVKILQPTTRIFLTAEERTLGRKKMGEGACKGNIRALLCLVALIVAVGLICVGLS